MSGFISSPRDCLGYKVDSEILWDNRYKWEVVWNYRVSVQTVGKENGYHAYALSKSFVTSILGEWINESVSKDFSFSNNICCHAQFSASLILRGFGS